MSQSLYSWYRGSDDSTFYWETAGMLYSRLR